VWSYCDGRGFGIKGLASGLGFGFTHAIFSLLSTCFPEVEAVFSDDDGADVDGCGRQHSLFLGILSNIIILDKMPKNSNNKIISVRHIDVWLAI